MGQSSGRSTPLIMRRHRLSSGCRSQIRSEIAHGKTTKLVDGHMVPQVCACPTIVLTDVPASKDCAVALCTSRSAATGQLTVMSRPCDTAVLCANLKLRVANYLVRL